MPASISGIFTLATLVLAGPFAWSVAGIIKSRRKEETSGTVDASKQEGNESAREEVSSMSYLLGLLGYAIGIGNLWRFPYLVGKWGGGAFIVAYLICLFLVAIPAFMIEMVMGQYTRKSTIGCFTVIQPRWAGLGLAQVIMLFMCLSYYNTLLAYSIIYIGGSLVDPLPWAGDSARYWHEDVLNSYNGEYDGHLLGPVQWKIAVALLLVWAIVCVSIVFGKEMLAKVTWVTVVGPIVMLFVLLARAVTLDGASDGIEFYIGKFDASALYDLKMWAAACGQILFSLSPGFGTAITMSSYTRKNENVFRTCLTVALSNSAFSLIGGFAIFSFVGNITYRINAAGGNTTVAEQAKAGTGLAFIALADGMRTFGSGTNVMSVIFFMVLFTLGVDSTFAWVETFVSYVEDFFASSKVKFKPARPTIVGCVSTVFFLTGLLYCTRMGNELLDVVDHYVASYFLLFGVALEAFMFTFDFGWRRLVVHVKASTIGNPRTPAGQDVVPALFWRAVIPVAVPAMSLFLFSYTLYDDLRAAYGGYPAWLQAIGWLLLCVLLVVTPLGGFWQWSRRRTGTLPPLNEEELALAKALASSQESPISPASPEQVTDSAPSIDEGKFKVVL